MVDYASIEFRIAAWLAHEPTILANYAKDKNWDPHRYFAAQFYGIPEELVEVTGPTVSGRSRSRVTSASCIWAHPTHWSSTGKRVGVAINMPTARPGPPQAFRRIYRGFCPWWDSIYGELQDQGFIESPTGRRRHFGDFGLTHFSDRLSMWREAVNFHVQKSHGRIAAARPCRPTPAPRAAGSAAFRNAVSFDLHGRLGARSRTDPLLHGRRAVDDSASAVLEWTLPCHSKSTSKCGRNERNGHMTMKSAKRRPKKPVSSCWLSTLSPSTVLKVTVEGEARAAFAITQQIGARILNGTLSEYPFATPKTNEPSPQ